MRYPLRTLLIAVAVLPPLIALPVVTVLTSFKSHQGNRPNREAILQIRDAIRIGTSQADVMARYTEHRTSALKLIEASATEWLITMPLEFGATDWTLMIEFQNGKVSAVRMRTSDGPPPRSGPSDKLAAAQAAITSLETAS